MLDVRDNTELHRFELDVDGHIAFVTYEIGPGRIILQHTEVPKALSGRGVGSTFARGVLDEIRRRDLHVVPRCEFVAEFIARNPAYADLVEPESP